MSTPTLGVTSTATEILNTLLRGQLAAAQSYEQALAKFDKHPSAVRQLRAIHDDHQESVRALRDHVTKHGGTPSETAGPWGAFVAVVTEAAKVIGPDTTLADLKQGEEHGIADYEAALKKDALPAECKTLIESTLLARCRSHLGQLDAIRNSIK